MTLESRALALAAAIGADIKSLLSKVTPGSWQAVTYGTNIGTAAGYPAVQVRLHNDRVEFKGRVTTSGAYTLGNTFMTLPSGYRPTEPRALGGRGTTGHFAYQIAATTGVVTLSVGVTTGATLELDGLSFPLT